MEAVSYQVELRAPGDGQSGYWGMSQENFATRQGAEDNAREDCPAGWRWRVVRVRLDVVSEGEVAQAA